MFHCLTLSSLTRYAALRAGCHFGSKVIGQEIYICEVIKQNESLCWNVILTYVHLSCEIPFDSYCFQLDEILYIFGTINLILMRCHQK